MKHPLSLRTHARIDICEGGSQSVVMKDSLTLMKHSADELSAREHVLYINTIASPDAIAAVADKISLRQRGKVLTFSASDAKLTERLQFLSCMCVVKNVRTIILTTFDFAAITSHQRTQIVHWLRNMRDGHGIQVIVYAVWPPRNEGALAQLAWFADSITKTGEWRIKRSALDFPDVVAQNASLAAAEFKREIEVPVDLQEPEHTHVDHADSPFAFAKDLSQLSQTTIDEFLAAHPLKNNDLAPVEREEEVLEDVILSKSYLSRNAPEVHSGVLIDATD